MGHSLPWHGAQGNFLLAGLPQIDRDLTSRYLEPVSLEPHRALYDPDVPITHVWFPDAGLVSLLGILTDGTAVQTSVIGREGMVGMPVFHDADRMAEQAVVQTPVRAMRMSAEHLRLCLRESPSLDRVLHHYAAARHMFAAQSVACMRKHDTAKRLARWLLHAADHSGTHELPFTHLFVAHMLGVRRSSVTIAASELRMLGLVAYSRSHLAILDHDALAAYACDCYQIVKSTYDRLLFGVTSHNPLSDLEISRDGFSTRVTESHKATPPGPPSAQVA